MRRLLLVVAVELLSGCAIGRRAPQTALLLSGGPVFGHPGADAVLVRGNRIAAIGRFAALAVMEPSARRVDARGGLILPGFHDAHLHLLDGGLSLGKLNLAGAKTEAQAAELVRDWAAAHPGSGTVWGLGWGYDIVPPGEYPTALALDAVVAERPVILESFDGHAYWLNGAALARAGIKDSSGTLIEPEGDVLESAGGAFSRQEKTAAMQAGLAHLARFGVTSTAAMSADPEEFEILSALEARGELSLRVFYCPSLLGDLAGYEDLRRRAHGPLLRFGWLKGFVDGVIESKTAALLEAYADSSEKGTPALPSARLNALVAAAQAKGFAVALHTVGDAAARAGLDAFAAADRTSPRPSRRRRLEHLEILDAADLPRFKALDTVASMQPLHAVPPGPEGDGAWSRNLGPERRARSFGWRALRDAGATLAFGSDWTVASPNPLEGLAAVTGVLTPAEGVRAYSAGPAYAAGLEHELGCLEPGCLADLVVLDPAVQLDDPASLRAGRVRAVVVDGRVILK